ncbi:ABC transporter permease [Virgibacillus sp. MSP4-1]|uniref:ABC transporter permease n=1 Tax=Virgibacillus sp. MSP4-1 TaxID=2700081 RepID=UPI0003A7DE47|nr:ABC transporter permease [Virgibacillus sp. MSP4-1]QHS23683.1 ABC transporter permease [Virgibacillus sp. MSP4-1]
MQELWDYMMNNQTLIWTYTLEHMQLVGLSVVIAIAIGVPLGIYLTTNDYLAETVLQMANVMMTIPSIALFGIMIPILSLIDQGIGFVPAVIALILYSQLPIIRNTYVAIKNVDPHIKDAAKGMGMNTIQKLRKVEIPNALPVIMAGVRQAVIMNIGIGAIAAFIGAGGLGVLINQGIARTNSTIVMAGAIAISIMAIVVDMLLGLFQKKMTPKGLEEDL